ncbi:MAG: sugar phosphate isomerase/epimerase [Deltaproteobacteria bacterium]|nr:MAG: sugar phosphate isomerase/epimerase [Deltaproteobacteria bacterium]
MKKSIGDNMFLKEWGFDKGLALVKKAGYDGIELWLGATPWFSLETTDAQVRELRRKVDDAGLVVSNVSNSLDWDRPLSARDPRVRAQATAHITRQIETAQILGTDAILVVAGLVTEETPYQEVYPRTVEGLQKLAETAAKARVKIGCENCCSEQRFVGLHLDVGNIHDTGFPEQWIEIHGPRITRVHVKDVMRHRGRCGSESVYTNLFLGDNNWKAIREAFRKVGYDGWLIAEMEARYRHAQDQQFYDTAAAIDRFVSGQL